MSKILRLQNLATLQALNSNCNQKHGALITKGNKIYATGCNDNMRGKFQGKIDCCMHAEMSACNNFINNIVRVNKDKYRVLWGKKRPSKRKI